MTKSLEREREGGGGGGGGGVGESYRADIVILTL
jgi:hypothetical protein